MNLSEKNNDTLYFIYEEDESSGSLYLGSKLIAGSGTIEGAQVLSDLQDVLISANLNENDCLIYDISGQWVNKPIKDILPIFIGTIGEIDGVSGLVPAPTANQTNMFLRSDGTWAEVVTKSIETDNVTLESVDGVLSIVGFKEAPEGAQPIKNEDGSLGWVKPDLTAVETLQEDVKNIEQILNPTDEEGNPIENGLISKVENLKEIVGKAAEYDEEENLIAAATGLYAELDQKANAEDTKAELDLKANVAEVEEALELKANVSDVNDALNLKANASEMEDALKLKANAADVYTKKDTDSAIAAAIANVDHLSREIVDILPDIEDANLNTIYMTPSGLQADDNKYYEWILINGVFEQVGSWEVDLKIYAKAADVEAALNTKVDKDGDSRLMTLGEGIKLKGITENAEKNIINSISADFEIISDGSHDRKLVLKPIEISKVINLENELNNKVDKEEGWTLLSPTNQEKLAKLSIDTETGNVGISGTVNIENVQGLEDWLNKNAATTPGLSENNLTDELYNKLVNQLLIKSVDTLQLDVTNGHLSIKNIDYSNVTGLNDVLALKAENSTVTQLSTKVNSLETLINDNMSDVSDRFEEMEKRLTWQNLSI